MLPVEERGFEVVGEWGEVAYRRDVRNCSSPKRSRVGPGKDSRFLLSQSPVQNWPRHAGLEPQWAAAGLLLTTHVPSSLPQEPRGH